MLLFSPLRFSAHLRRSWPSTAGVGVCVAGSTTRSFTHLPPRRFLSWTSRRLRSVHRNVVTSSSYLASPVRSGGGGKIGGRRIVVSLIGSSALIVLVGVGGTVAYARYVDPELRNRIEEDGEGFLSSLPIEFSRWLLDRVFGPKKGGTDEAIGRASESEQQHLQLSTKERAIQSGLVQKKLVRQQAAKEEQKTKLLVEAPSMRRATSQEEDSTTKKVAVEKDVTSANPENVEPVKDRNDVKNGRRIVSSDSTIIVENEALERLVKESVRDLESVVSSAIGGYEEATRYIRSDGKEKNAALATAETKAVEARAALQRIKDVVQQGRKSKLTSSNRALIEAEAVANRAIYGLQKAEAEVTLAESETNVLHEYQKLAEEGQQNVLSEMNAGEKDNKLSEEEIGRQVNVLQQQMVAQQNGEKYRVQKTLDAQRQEYEKLTNRRLDMELQRQQRDLEIIYRKKLGDLNDEYEQELLQQLRRQAAAHSEHLHDVVQAQKRQLVAEYGRRLEDLVLQTKHDFQTELSGSLGRLEGINAALKARAELDAATHRAQRIWVACQALRHSIVNGKLHAVSWEDQRKPLSSLVAAIQKAAGNDDKFVSVVLGSVPQKALSDGVFTEFALKDRFFRVNNACRRVALVGEQGGSLFRYALSYFQSLLLFNNANGSLGVKAEEEELADFPSIDVDSLDTFEILKRARRCMERGNMELALRYMNQLKGAPRAVARDWLAEARLLLEVSQVTDALLARTAATEVQFTAK